MKREMRDALASKAIDLGFHIVEKVILPWIMRLIDQGIDAPAALSDAAKIVRRIERDWPDYTGEDKARMARVEIAALMQNRNGRRPALRDVNRVLELAVGELDAATDGD